MYDEKLQPMRAKEQSPAQRIFEMIQDYSPQVQREALDEAEKLIHQNFEMRMSRLKEEAEAISKQWEIFKGNA